MPCCRRSWPQLVPSWAQLLSEGTRLGTSYLAKTRMAKDLMSDFRMKSKPFLARALSQYPGLMYKCLGIYKMLPILPSQHLYFWSLSIIVRGQCESRKSLHRQARTVPGTFQAYCWYRQLIPNDSQDLGLHFPLPVT